MLTRVLQIVADGMPGGGTTHVLQLLYAWKAKYEISLITQINSYLAAEVESLGTRVYPVEFFRSRFDPRVPANLYTAINDFNPNLIHVHGGRAGFFLSFVPTDIPIIYTLHGVHFVQKPEPMRTLGVLAERRAMQKASHVVFVAEYDQNLAKAFRLLPKNKSNSVIYNGIQIEEIPQALPPRWDVGFIGRMEEPKDPMLFVEMLCHMPFSRAVMVGGGGLENFVRERLASLGLASRVDFMGSLSRPDALEILRQVRVLVMTSRWEGLPILPLEAMAAGIPVVASAVGGLSEVLGEGAGILVTERKPQAFACAVENLLSDRSLRTSVLKQASIRVKALFSQDAMLSRLESLYQNAFSIN